MIAPCKRRGGLRTPEKTTSKSLSPSHIKHTNMKKSIKYVFIIFCTIVLIYLTLLVYSKFIAPIPFQQIGIKTVIISTITTTGVGRASATEEGIAQISFGITKTAPTTQEAEKQADTLLLKIESDLQNAGINSTKLKRTINQTFQDADITNTGTNIKGFTVNRQYELQIDNKDHAQESYNILKKNNTSSLSGISFVVDPIEVKKAERKATEEAVGNARENALRLTNAGGLQLGRVIKIEEKTNNYYLGEDSVNVTVSVTFETY